MAITDSELLLNRKIENSDQNLLLKNLQLPDTLSLTDRTYILGVANILDTDFGSLTLEEKTALLICDLFVSSHASKDLETTSLTQDIADKMGMTKKEIEKNLDLFPEDSLPREDGETNLTAELDKLLDILQIKKPEISSQEEIDKERDILIDKIIELRSQGKKPPEIANILGIKQSKVRDLTEMIPSDKTLELDRIIAQMMIDHPDYSLKQITETLKIPGRMIHSKLISIANARIRRRYNNDPDWLN